MSDIDRIEAYLAGLPDQDRAMLSRVRAVIRATCPEAREVIAYGMPAFRLGGQLLLSYAGYKRFCSIYPASGMVREALGDDLAPYLAEKATIRFTPDRPIPETLVRRIVEVRIAESTRPHGGG